MAARAELNVVVIGAGPAGVRAAQTLDWFRLRSRLNFCRKRPRIAWYEGE